MEKYLHGYCVGLRKATGKDHDTPVTLQLRAYQGIGEFATVLWGERATG